MEMQTVQNNVTSRTSGYMPVWGQEKPLGERNSPHPTNNSEENFNDVLVKASERTAGSSKIQEISSDEWSFFDFLDVINPLQHIPLVSSIYRAITGDEIKPAAIAMGGMLYGGPIGIVTGSVNAAVAEATGHGVTENLVVMATGSNIGNKPEGPDSTINENDVIMLANEDNTNNDETVISAASVKIVDGDEIKPVDSKSNINNSDKDRDNPNNINTPQAFLPPELIAQEMMSALDKYHELKSGGG